MSAANERELDEVLHALEEDVGAAPAPSADERTRVVGGRYEIVEQLGAGGMGEVLLVRHLRLGKLFALKRMHASFSLQPEAEQLFHREALLASQLSHPGIVEMVDFGHDPDWGWFIVMEYVKGEPLATHVGQGPLPIAVVCDIASQLADALRHSHGKGVVHADVKAENVLCVTPDDEDADRRHWQVKLLDFGTAQFGTTHATSVPEKRVSGTPEYMAPERAVGGPIQPSLDIYAVGILMYEMLTGKPPFTGEPADVLARHVGEMPEPAGARRGEVLDARLDAILDKALAKDPKQRYASAEDLLTDLRGYMDVLGLHKRAGAISTSIVARASERMDAGLAAFDSLRLPVAGLWRDGTIVVANPAFARLLGGDVDAAVGRNAQSTFLEHVNPALHDDLRVVALNGKIIRRDLTIERDGRTSTVRYVLSPASGSCGHCLLVLYPV